MARQSERGIFDSIQSVPLMMTMTTQNNKKTEALHLSQDLLESLTACAAREGTDVETLAAKWLTERRNEELRQRMLKAAGNKPCSLVLSSATCAVTAFDLKVEISRDGRKRGLWVILRDESPQRMRFHQESFERHLKARTEHPLTALTDDRQFNGGLLRESGLLEWPAAKSFHAAMGKAIHDQK